MTKILLQKRQELETQRNQLNLQYKNIIKKLKQLDYARSVKLWEWTKELFKLFFVFVVIFLKYNFLVTQIDQSINYLQQQEPNNSIEYFILIKTIYSIDSKNMVIQQLNLMYIKHLFNCFGSLNILWRRLTNLSWVIVTHNNLSRFNSYSRI